MRRLFTLAAVIAVLLLSAGCSQPTSEVGTGQPAPGIAVPGSSGESAPQDRPLVAFLGDSLTAGLGVAADEAFPDVASRLLASRGREIRVLNAGVSGDTSAGGLSRLSWVLSSDPEVIVIGLGANDGLRGQSLEAMESNLEAIVRQARQAGARVLLLGIRIPPSYGPEYSSGFARVYERVASRTDVLFVPDFLEGVGGRRSMNLDDGIHPNRSGHQRLAENILEELETLLSRQR